MDNEPFHRQTAYKLMIKELLEAEYIKGEGWSPSYVKIYGHKVSRVNTIGIVVEVLNSQPQKRILFDDGTGRIPIESSAFAQPLPNPEIGDQILVIGKLREFQTERIIFAEIIKHLSSLDWLKVRNLEYTSRKSLEKKHTPELKQELHTSSNNSLPKKVYSLIKSLDQGEGVDIEKLIYSHPKEQTEKIIHNLLEEGEIFEVKPGRVKIL